MKRLKARLGDVLMKEWTLIGITPVVIAVTALGGAEKGVNISDEENMTFPQRRLVYIFPAFNANRMSQGLIYARAAMSTNFYIDKGKVLTSIMLFQREVLDLSSNSIVTILHPFSLPGDLTAQT
jgi:hypothetical protein